MMTAGVVKILDIVFILLDQSVFEIAFRCFIQCYIHICVCSLTHRALFKMNSNLNFINIINIINA